MPAMTSQGRAKTLRLMRGLQAGLSIALQAEARTARTVAATAAPSPDEEALTLSAGLVMDGSYVGQLLGTPTEERFLKQGMVSLQEAIATDPVEPLSAGTGLTAYGTGDASKINRRSGFFWRSPKRGVLGPTFPFNYALLQAWEFGGIAWLVVPRPENPGQFLSPAPGVATTRMLKTLYPRGMYRQAKAATLSDGTARVRASVKAAMGA